MNPPTLPPSLNPPRRRSGCGCLLYTLLGLVILAVAVVAFCYWATLHTSMPFSTLASMAESAGAGSHLRINGVSGSISSGIGIRSITWDDGELGDIQVTYNGLSDLVTNKQLIFHEVKVGKAHLTLTGWTKTENQPSDQQKNRPSTEQPEQPKSPGLKLFRIDHLILADITLKNPLDNFDLSIPKIELTGFQVSDGKVNFDAFTADSDRLKIATTDSTTAGFKKRVDVTLLPKLSNKIRQPIHATIDAGENACHVVAFDNKLDFEIKPDHSGSLRCANLNLADYYDGPLPQELTLDLSTAQEPGKKEYPLKVGAGSFKLGQHTFEILPRTFNEETPSTPAHVDLAVSHAPEGDFAFELQSTAEDPNNAKLVLTAKPPQSPKDTVAHLFLGKAYADLTPDEQKAVDAKTRFFHFAAP